MRYTQHLLVFKRWLLPALIIAAACFVYLYRIGDKPLDFDERYSVNIAAGTGGTPSQYRSFGLFAAEPIPGVVFHSNHYAARASLQNVVSAAMNDNGQGLPYFLLLHSWLKLFGITTMSARCLSALLMAASLALLYGLFYRLRLKCNISLAALALFSGNGVIIGLAQYVRFYSLGILLVVASLHLLFSIKETRRRRLMLFILGLLWALLFLNQYFAVFVIVPEALFLMPQFRQSAIRRNIWLLIAGLLLPVLIWLLPFQAWESLRNIYALHHESWQAMISLTTEATPLNVAIALTSTFAGAFGQPVNFQHGNLAALVQIAPSIPALILAVIAVCRLRSDAWVRLCAGVLAVYTIASLVHAFSTGHTLLFQVRYWVFAYIFSYGLLAYAWTVRFGSARHLKLLSALVLVLSFARVAYTSASAVSGLVLTRQAQLRPLPMPPLEDYEAVACEIKLQARPGDTLSFRNWKTAQVVNWFLTDRPGLVQRVDSTQRPLIALCHGSERQDSVFIQRGRAMSARPVWLP